MTLVPKIERTAWHEKALNAASGADLHSLLELLTGTKETERLADVVRGSSTEALENVSHYATEPAAKRLEKNHPGLAARLWRLSGFQEAEDVFKRMLWLNPSDNQSVRFLIDDVRAGAAWQASRTGSSTSAVLK
jgi:hypothetical protein